MMAGRNRRSWDERGSFRGGRRLGAGRKKGCGKWGEETVVIRIPKSRVEQVMAFLATLNSGEMI